jgi:hypothetical protein
MARQSCRSIARPVPSQGSTPSIAKGYKIKFPARLLADAREPVKSLGQNQMNLGIVHQHPYAFRRGGDQELGKPFRISKYAATGLPS